MTQIVNPSIDRVADSFLTAGSFAYSGLKQGKIITSGQSTELAKQSSINDTVLNGFAYSTSASSLTVTVSPGEAFVFGSWLAKDTQTSVTLPAATTTKIYVGWDRKSANTVIVGTASDFSTTQTDNDSKIPIGEFTTDASGVTSNTDLREFESIDAETLNGKVNADITPDVSDNTAQVVQDVDDINVTGGFSASNDGDGSATVVGAPPYTDSDAISAINNESSLTVNISGDADKLNGYNFVRDGTSSIGTINFISQ